MGDLATSFAPVLLILAAGFLILPQVRPDNRIVRFIGAWLTVLLLVRYLYWRVTETLPVFDLSFESLTSWGFFAVEASSSFAGLLLLHVLSRTTDRSQEATDHPVQGFPGGPPLIDVVIPTYNEQKEILRRTIVGALAQDYPRFRVWVLDDGRRPWLAEMSEKLGAGYRTRGDNKHGKAGNMNATINWLHTLPEPPDVIAVLDADFVPTPAFLSRACALMHDEKVGVVQTPQHFFNPDPIQLNLGAAAIVPDEQRFFFDVILSSKDAHGTAFSCGTSALVRASCLKLIGGFPTESVTEDLLLSIKLKGLGYRTVYLNEPLTVGLAPEGLQEYLTQRGRWCLGTMQIVRTPWGPFGKAPTPLLMRLHTLDTVLFWTVGALIRVLCILVPILYWWCGLVVMRADLAGIVENLGPYWVCCVTFLGWVSRGTNVPVLAEAMALLVCRESLRASAIGLFGSRNQKFKVTAKGAMRDETVVQWSLVSWFLAAAGLTLGGLLLGVLRGPMAGTSPEVETMNLFWSLYNVITLAVASLMCIERPRFRREERFVADEAAEMDWEGGRAPVRITDISLIGCRVALPPGLGLGRGAQVRLDLAGVGPVQGEIRRVQHDSGHVAFDPSPDQQVAMIRKLFSGVYVRSVARLSPWRLARILMQRAFE
ncbi:glycosyltransferase [Acetobacteraceae bacterium H6797]|nr:glycosyltransferase [Acetobacteraceae bacterium H6797]